MSRPHRVMGFVRAFSRRMSLKMDGGHMIIGAGVHELLKGAGYTKGSRIVIMTAAEARELDRAWKKAGGTDGL